MRLRDFPVFDFSGGLVKNKSDYKMQKNEVKNSLNFDLDERGRAKTRRGIQQFGTASFGGAVIDNSYVWISQGAGASIFPYHLVIDRATDATLYRIVGAYTTSAIATTDTTINIGGLGLLTSTNSSVEINGDIISYTGSTTTTLTGCAGILKAHPTRSPVYQIQSIGKANVAVDTSCGAYFTTLNNLLIVNGRTGSATFDGTNFTAIADADEPNGLFATNYRQRVYVAGSLASGATSKSYRISYSAAGDATNWISTDWFEIEDDRGEEITALLENGDLLLIFKMNSIWTYNEIQAKQRIYNVGAYNQRVVQKIGKLIYTFCPTGVYVTNGLSTKKISQPVDEILKGFVPVYDAAATYGRVVLNCCAGQFENKYYLYLGDLTYPESSADVVLIYDTTTGKWTVHNAYPNMTHFGSFKRFCSRPNSLTEGLYVSQSKEALFVGDSAGVYYRLFEGRFYDNGVSGAPTPLLCGDDLYANLVANSSGSPISSVLETPFYDMGNPSWWKKFGFLRILIEQGEFNVSYRLDKGTHFTDWISLRNFKNPNGRMPLNVEGYRIALKITSNQKANKGIFNGFIIEDIEALNKHGR